jgi:hypothetical protein
VGRGASNVADKRTACERLRNPGLRVSASRLAPDERAHSIEAADVHIDHYTRESRPVIVGGMKLRPLLRKVHKTRG